MGGFFGGFGQAFGQQFSQMMQQKKAREMQAHTAELNAIGHLLDKPDLTDAAREDLTQRYMDVAGKMSPHASGILGKLLGRDPAKKAAPPAQNGTFSEDRIQAPPPEFTDTGAKYRSALPPVPGAETIQAASPQPLAEYQGADDFGSAVTSPAAAPVTRPPAPTSAPSPGLPPVPTSGGASGRMFKTADEKRAGKVADATAMVDVQVEAAKKRGTNATAERVNLEKQLEPLREKQRQAQEVAMQARQVAVQQARNEGRMVKAGIGPKPGGLPWEYVQSTAYADGSVVETPASPPAHVQTIYQMAAAKVAQSGEPPTVENLQKSWNELMTVKAKKMTADAKGADARATQTELRNSGKLPAPNRAPGASGAGKPPTKKDYDQIEKDYQSSLRTLEAQHNNRRQAVELNKTISSDQRKKQLERIEAERETAKKTAETAYNARIKSIQGGGGGGGGKKPAKILTMQQIIEHANTHLGGDIEKGKRLALADGFIIKE